MMKYLLSTALLIFFVGCAAPKRININLVNVGSQPIVVKTKAGLITQKISVDPGETWYGYRF